MSINVPATCNCAPRSLPLLPFPPACPSGSSRLGTTFMDIPRLRASRAEGFPWELAPHIC
eukprot:10033288-Heterocapsa_arctica.AAC.1